MSAPLEPWLPARVVVRVPGKINLHLGVGAREADGYHPLATVFEAVSLCDDVAAVVGEPGEFTVTTSGEGAEHVPGDESNLALRAARLLAERHGHADLGVHLAITKSIPVAAGMAGGSADAAGALLACSVLWDLDVDPVDLQALGAALGADVPFCLLGGTALGTGRGDRLSPVLSRGRRTWVLVLADGGLSTPAVYRHFDESDASVGAQGTRLPEELLAALASGRGWSDHLHNDLAPAAIALAPRLADVLALGQALGAEAGIVSGSGPTVALACRDEGHGKELEALLHEEGWTTRRVHGPVQGARIIG